MSPEYLPHPTPLSRPIEPIAFYTYLQPQAIDVSASNPIHVNFYITALSINNYGTEAIAIFVGPPGLTTLPELRSSGKPLMKYRDNQHISLIGNYTNTIVPCRSGPYPRGSCVYCLTHNLSASARYCTAVVTVELVTLVEDYPEQPD